MSITIRYPIQAAARIQFNGRDKANCVDLRQGFEEDVKVVFERVRFSNDDGGQVGNDPDGALGGGGDDKPKSSRSKKTTSKKAASKKAAAADNCAPEVPSVPKEFGEPWPPNQVTVLEATLSTRSKIDRRVSQVEVTAADPAAAYNYSVEGFHLDDKDDSRIAIVLRHLNDQEDVPASFDIRVSRVGN